MPRPRLEPQDSDLAVELAETASVLDSVERETGALEGRKTSRTSSPSPISGRGPAYRRVDRRTLLEQRLVETRARLEAARRAHELAVAKAASRANTRMVLVAVSALLVLLPIVVAWVSGRLGSTLLAALPLAAVIVASFRSSSRRRARRSTAEQGEGMAGDATP